MSINTSYISITGGLKGRRESGIRKGTQVKGSAKAGRRSLCRVLSDSGANADAGRILFKSSAGSLCERSMLTAILNVNMVFIIFLLDVY